MVDVALWEPRPRVSVAAAQGRLIQWHTRAPERENGRAGLEGIFIRTRLRPYVECAVFYILYYKLVSATHVSACKPCCKHTVTKSDDLYSRLRTTVVQYLLTSIYRNIDLRASRDV